LRAAKATPLEILKPTDHKPLFQTPVDVRMVTGSDGVPGFVASEVSKVLGYQNDPEYTQFGPEDIFCPQYGHQSAIS
jgi:hypothetical protein